MADAPLMPEGIAAPRGCLDEPAEGRGCDRRAITVHGWIDLPGEAMPGQVDVEIRTARGTLPRIRTSLRDRPDVRKALGLAASARNGFNVVADLSGFEDAMEKEASLVIGVFQGARLLMEWNRRVAWRNETPQGFGKPVPDYDQDGLVTVHNNEFMLDGRFRAAYGRGVEAAGTDYGFQWRVHIALWAAAHAARLPGDFVECGVNAGFVSSAVMRYLDWDKLGKTFYLLDTFKGLDEKQISAEEAANGVFERNRDDLERGFYVTDAARVRKNFAEWKNIRMIEGSIPDTLPRVTAKEIAFLHLDLNCSLPEVAAMEFFWGRLSDGAVVLLDDYAYAGFRSQKLAMDRFAAGKGVEIASLPTGQGLMLRPPRPAKNNHPDAHDADALFIGP